MTVKAYSKLNLIGDERYRIENKGLFNQLFYTLTKFKLVPITVHLPSRLWLRCEVLCDDVTIVGNYERAFTVTDLIRILFDDFLAEVRRDENFTSLYKRLTARSQAGPIITSYYDSKSLIEEADIVRISIQLERKAALRGEVLLCDLANVYPHNFMLESLLELIVTDFVQAYQKGATKHIIKRIIAKYDRSVKVS